MQAQTQEAMPKFMILAITLPRLEWVSQARRALTEHDLSTALAAGVGVGRLARAALERVKRLIACKVLNQARQNKKSSLKLLFLFWFEFLITLLLP